MKNYTVIVLLSIVILLGFAYRAAEADRYKAEISRLSVNLANYGSRAASLNLTNQELMQEIEKGNRTLQKTDSILKARDKKISQLERVIETTIVISDPDTTFLEVEKGIPVFLEKPHTTYKSKFSETKSCVTIEGFILSSDPDPSIAITKRQVNVTSYLIETERRWWQFWKPKFEKIITSDCGAVTITEITNN